MNADPRMSPSRDFEMSGSSSTNQDKWYVVEMGCVCLIYLLAAYTCSGPSAQVDLCVWIEELRIGLLRIGVGVFVSFLN